MVQVLQVVEQFTLTTLPYVCVCVRVCARAHVDL